MALVCGLAHAVGAWDSGWGREETKARQPVHTTPRERPRNQDHRPSPRPPCRTLSNRRIETRPNATPPRPLRRLVHGYLPREAG